MFISVRQFLVIALLLAVLCISSRATQTKRTSTPPGEDLLARHLSAAATYQLSGDLERAGEENRAITAIALARLGAIAMREGQLQRAVQLLGDSLAVRDNPDTRTDLAIAFMRLREVERGVSEAQAAIALEEKNARAHHVLGKLLYMKADYAGARLELERASVLEPDLDAAYTLGMTYLRLKQIDRAKLLFEEMQRALGNNANVHLLFGRAYEETGFSSEAEREFRQALTIDNKAPRGHFYLGYVILQHGGSERLAQAREEFERELQLDPQSVFSNYFLGVLASNANEHSKAVSYLLETIRLNPMLREAYLYLGQSQAELGDPSAEKNLRRAIELTTDVSQNGYQIKRAHFTLGRVLLKAGRRAEAEKELAIARDLQSKSLESSRQNLNEILGNIAASTNDVAAPSQIASPANGSEDRKEISASGATEVLVNEDSPMNPQQVAKYQRANHQLSEVLAQAFHNLGVIAAQQDQLPVSLKWFAAASQWKADLAGLDRNWGIVSFRAGQYETSIAALFRHLNNNPEDALTRRMLAVSYYLRKEFPKVAQTLKPLERTITTDPELTYIYGVSLIQLTERAQAGKLFESLSLQNPKDAMTRFYAGQGFAMLENYEGALKEFRSAATLDPKMLQVHYHAGQSLIRLNRMQDAEKAFRAELLLDAADDRAKYHLAYVLLEQKQQVPAAIALLREIVSSQPQYADARYQLGKTLIDLGQVNEAIEHLEVAARAEPSKDYIRYQLSIAYRRASRTADADRELQVYRELKATNRNQELPGNVGTRPNAP